MSNKFEKDSLEELKKSANEVITHQQTLIVNSGKTDAILQGWVDSMQDRLEMAHKRHEERIFNEGATDDNH